MKNLELLKPAIYLAVGLIIGFSFGGNRSAEKAYVNKLEQERERLTEAISQKDAQIIELAAESEAIREKMYLDSLRFSDALNANKRAYLALKKKYNEINLSRASAHDLDSLLNVLFPE